MAKTFVVEYDDFSGGHYVGPSSQRQPRNTWQGLNAVAVELDGMLMADAPWEPRASFSSFATQPPLNLRVDDTLTNLWWSTDSQLSWVGVLPWTGNKSQQNLASTSARGRVARYGNYSLAAAGGAASYAAWDGFTLTWVSTVSVMTDLVTWGQFIVGVESSASQGARLRFSTPGFPLTNWASNDFIDIGSSTTPITALVVYGQSLYVGKPDGWWAITGVLGQLATTGSIVQITNEGPSSTGYPNLLAGAVVAADGRLMFAGRNNDGTVARQANGSLIQPAGYAPFVANYGAWQIGGYTFVAGPRDANIPNGGFSYIWIRSPTGKWRRSVPLSSGLASMTPFAIADGPAVSPYGYAFTSLTSDPTGAAASPARLLLSPADPPVALGGTTFASATVTLAEYQSNNRFRIKNVIAELDLGTTALNAPRTIGVQINTPGVPVEAASSSVAFSAAASTSQTSTLSALASTAGQRVTVRFQATDGAPTFTAIPVVTLKGVKLRRLTMHCEEVVEGGGN